MTHHTKDIFCSLCEEKLEGCHPALRDSYRSIKMEFKNCHISWGYRDEIDQELFFKDHKTLAHYPHSKHNVTQDGKPCSHAVDLFQWDGSLPNFSPKYYLEIWQFIKEEDLPLVWAGNWTQSKEHFCETDHFQLSEEFDRSKET